MLKIVTAPDPVLSSIAKPVAKVNASVVEIIEQMKKALIKTADPKGVGLAAPQVGKALRIFMAKPTDKSKILVFINPKITTNKKQLTTDKKLGISSQGPIVKSQQSKATKLEGCLSLQNIWGKVKRDPTVTISYLDEQGKHHRQKFSGFLATIIQHEVDHLNGVLFPKRVLEQKETLYKSSKNEKNEDIFEEIEI